MRSSARHWRFTDIWAADFWKRCIQEALETELALRGIPNAREVDLPVRYKGETLRCAYRADFICYNEIIVELKALDRLTGVEDAQVLNYLKATGMQRALLFNFGALKLEYRRLVRDYLR